MKMPACMDAATIAAFVDGTLDAPSRGRVVAHLATCPDCSELVAEVVRTDGELSSAPRSDAGPRRDAAAPAKVLWMRRRGLAAMGGVLAVAASIAFLLLNRATVDPLVAMIGSERPTLARPTGGFRPGPVSSPRRAEGRSTNLQIEAEVARRLERARLTNSAEDLRAAGVAQLVARDTAGAVQSLEAASRGSGATPQVWADLGAALMTRFIERGDPDDATRALAALDEALGRNASLAEAQFNKALLLEHLQQRDQALSAWGRYLELSDGQGWRDEAIRRRDALQRQ